MGKKQPFLKVGRSYEAGNLLVSEEITGQKKKSLSSIFGKTGKT
jgi:hypothetical protein